MGAERGTPPLSEGDGVANGKKWVSGWLGFTGRPSSENQNELHEKLRRGELGGTGTLYYECHAVGERGNRIGSDQRANLGRRSIIWV